MSDSGKDPTTIAPRNRGSGLSEGLNESVKGFVFLAAKLLREGNNLV